MYSVLLTVLPASNAVVRGARDPPGEGFSRQAVCLFLRDTDFSVGILVCTSAWSVYSLPVWSVCTRVITLASGLGSREGEEKRGPTVLQAQSLTPNRLRLVGIL